MTARDSELVAGHSMYRRLLSVLTVVAAAVAAAPKPAAEPPTTEPIANFVRFDEDRHGGGKMQAAFATYRNDDGIQVDLLPTMHIGEAGFFRDLAKKFPKYDAVLYELVAHKGEPATEEGVNPQQAQIADDMQLDNQGPHMNYDRKNFVHADLDYELIEKLEVAQNGTFKGALGEGPGLKSATSERQTAGDRQVFADKQAAQSAPPAEKTRLMRRAYSRILELTARPKPGTTFPAGMEVLVGARNDKVMATLDEQLAAGKRKVAILYGAAHMVDMEHRLFARGFKRTSMTWMTTWTVADDGTPTTRPVTHR
jgi:hypothetical protein